MLRQSTVYMPMDYAVPVLVPVSDFVLPLSLPHTHTRLFLIFFYLFIFFFWGGGLHTARLVGMSGSTTTNMA